MLMLIVAYETIQCLAMNCIALMKAGNFRNGPGTLTLDETS
jgi:hypothetical protein